MPKISFCIPTYNRVGHLLLLVNQILSSEYKDLEVVVQDNNSTDSTMLDLRNINDDRLTIFSNSENRGSLFNMVDVLHKGKGDFLFFLTDKDYIFTSEISIFIDFLNHHNNIAAGYCSSIKETGYQIYEPGLDALRHLAYIGNHPSGYFFKRDIFNAMDFKAKYTNFDVVELFPFEFMLADIASSSSVAIYKNNMVGHEKKEDAEKIKSHTINGNDPKAYFNPSSRIRMSIRYFTHAYNLYLDGVNKSLLYFEIFSRGLYEASFGYRNLLSDGPICIHHFIKPRKVGNVEILRYLIRFYFQYMIAMYKKMTLFEFVNVLLFINLKLVKKVIGRGIE